MLTFHPSLSNRIACRMLRLTVSASQQEYAAPKAKIQGTA